MPASGGNHATLIPDSHAHANQGARRSPILVEERSESPKSESPEPGSVIKTVPPARGFTPGTQLQLAHPSREGSVQLLNRVQVARRDANEHVSSLESPPPDAESRLRTPTHATSVDQPATRTSNPRSLSKGSRSKTNLQTSRKDIFAVPSDIDSTQEWQPLGVKKRNTARASLRKLGGPKFKPFEPQRDSESPAQQAPAAAEPANEEAENGDGEGSSYDISVPVGGRNPRRSPAQKPISADQANAQTKQPRRLGDIMAGKPAEAAVNKGIEVQDDETGSVSAILKASTKVDGSGTKGTSVDETEGSQADEDVQMEDAPAIDDAAASSRSEAEDKSSASEASEESSGEDTELSIPAGKASAANQQVLPERSNGTTSAQDTASKASSAGSSTGISEPADAEATKKSTPQPSKSGTPRTNGKASARKDSKDSRIEKLSEEIRQQRQLTSELSKKNGHMTPGKKSITAPIPTNTASKSKRSSTSGSVTESPRETPSRSALPVPSAKPPTKLSSVSTRRSVSFADETPARKSPSPAPSKTCEPSSKNGIAKSNANPAEAQTKPNNKKKQAAAAPAKQSKVNDFRAALFASIRPPTAEPAAPQAADPVASKPAKAGGKRKQATATKAAATNSSNDAANANGKTSDTGSDAYEKGGASTKKNTRKKSAVESKTKPAVKKGKAALSAPEGSAKGKINAKRGATKSEDAEAQSDGSKGDPKPEDKGAPAPKKGGPKSKSPPVSVSPKPTSDQSNEEAMPEMRDAARSRSPAKAVETSTDGELEGSSESGSEADKPEAGKSKGRVSKTVQDPEPRQQSPSSAPKSGKENGAKSTKKDAKGNGPAARAVPISDDETSSDEESEREGTTSATSKSVSEQHVEADSNSESKSSSGTDSSSESDQEDLPPPKTGKSKKPKALSGSSEEDDAGKQLRQEATQSKNKNSQDPKPSLPTPNSSQLAKALRVNPNPSSSFGGATKFSELSKQSFVAAPVQHRMPGNPAYKMPFKSPNARKNIPPQDSDDSEDSASSDEGGPDQLWQRIWSQHLTDRTIADEYPSGQTSGQMIDRAEPAVGVRGGGDR